jgi:hypothetical protein
LSSKRSSRGCARTPMIKFFGAKVLHDVVDRSLPLHGAL